MAKGIKNWLKDSYAVHGCSTDSTSKPRAENMDDTPTGKVNRTAKKNTEMSMTSKHGNSSGGGGRQLSTKSPDRTGGNVKMMSGIVGSRKQ